MKLGTLRQRNMLFFEEVMCAVSCLPGEVRSATQIHAMSKRWAIPINSWLILSGPFNCGKSHLGRTLLQQLEQHAEDLEFPEFRAALVSSQANKLWIEQPSECASVAQPHKFDPALQELNFSAMEFLKAQLHALCHFPAKTHVVIIDTVALTVQFHAEICELARLYGYLPRIILFEFSNDLDYFTYVAEDDLIVREEIKHRVEYMKKQLIPKLPTLYREDAILHVRNARWTKLTARLLIRHVDRWKLSELRPRSPRQRYFVIGDVHECVDELKQLLQKVGYTIDALQGDRICHSESTQDQDIIFVGDLIDKNVKSEEMLAFIHAQLEECKDSPRLYFVRGNHEQKLAKLLENHEREMETDAKDGVSAEDHAKFFTAYARIKDNPVAKYQFQQIYAQMRPYYHFQAPAGCFHSRSFYVTHSLCPSRYLGKLYQEASQAQTAWHIDRSSGELRYELGKLIPPHSYSAPLLLSGHFTLEGVYNGTLDPTKSDDNTRTNNVVLLDTGATNGGFLSGAVVGCGLKQPVIHQVQTKPSEWGRRWVPNLSAPV